MEEEKQPWSTAANWIVADGSLQNSVFFESPLNLLSDEPNNCHHPLILNPSPSHSKPCEITISFEQSYEVQRVYVRSTARVYEIYYARKHGDENEYLCTVRCGECSTETMNPSEEMTKNSSSYSSNEDDWVEIKNPLDDGANSSSTLNIPGGKTNRNAQVFYEATAEITDAYPCVSLTLRFLSIQTKGSVCIEEIYIFAEPVESTDSSSQLDPVGSADRSLLAMLVPSLLHLSKTNKSSGMQDKPISGIEQKHDYQERGLSKATDLPDLEEKIGGLESKAELVAEEKNLPEYNHFENVLEKLIVKVDKIEAFCSRMEEKMMGPISLIETRLQRMEQQLDELTLRSQLFESNKCSQSRALEFSDDYSESTHSDCSNNSETNQGENNLESTIKDIPAIKRCLSVNDAIASALAAFSATGSSVMDSNAARGPEICPGSIGTAPGFSNDDNHKEDGDLDLTEKTTSEGDGAPKFSDDDNHEGVTSPEFSARDPCGRTEDLHVDSYEVDETDFFSSHKTMGSSIRDGCSANYMDGRNEATDLTPPSMDPTTETKPHDADENDQSKTHLTIKDKSGLDFELSTLKTPVKERSNSRLDMEQSVLDVEFVSETNWDVRLLLEDLLGDLPVSEIEASDREQKIYGVNNQPLLEVEEITDFTEKDFMLFFEGEELKNPTVSERSEPYPDLI